MQSTLEGSRKVPVRLNDEGTYATPPASDNLYPHLSGGPAERDTPATVCDASGVVRGNDPPA